LDRQADQSTSEQRKNFVHRDLLSLEQGQPFENLSRDWGGDARSDGVDSVPPSISLGVPV
jgi:hypothetical protein